MVVVVMTIVVWHVVTVVVVAMSVVTIVVFLLWLWAGFRHLIADSTTSREDLDADLNVVLGEHNSSCRLDFRGNELNTEGSVIIHVTKGFAVEDRNG